MRQFTDKEINAFARGLMRYSYAIGAGRTQTATCEKNIRKALDCGITLDELFNKGNYDRACMAADGTMPDMTTYVELLTARNIESAPLRDENFWAAIDMGFSALAEAVHEIYIALTGFGGTYTTSNALNKLKAAIAKHSLQGILSERLMKAATEQMGASNYFRFVLAAANFDELPFETEMTEEQEQRLRENEELAQAGETEPDAEEPEPEDASEGTDTGAPSEGKSGETEETGGKEDETPAPEPVEMPDEDPNETVVIPQNPRDLKRSAVTETVFYLSADELKALAPCVRDGKSVTVGDIVDALTNSEYDPSKEDMVGKAVHAALGERLTPAFISCVLQQGLDMDEERASKYDVLLQDWDLRTDRTRRLVKLKSLAFAYGDGDPDIDEAVRDLEAYYAKENH